METSGNFHIGDKFKGCLNRTMQYGNSEMSQPSTGQAQFKSYYVVWKP